MPKSDFNHEKIGLLNRSKKYYYSDGFSDDDKKIDESSEIINLSSISLDKINNTKNLRSSPYKKVLKSIFYSNIFDFCLPINYSPCFSSTETKAYRRLVKRASIPYCPNNVEHKELLYAYWRVVFPDEEPDGDVCVSWTKLGFQGNDPSTDFRGGGFMSLQNMHYFAVNYNSELKKFLEESTDTQRFYPLSSVFINITYLIAHFLKLNSSPVIKSMVGRETASKRCMKNFLRVASKSLVAIDELFSMCTIFVLQQWKLVTNELGSENKSPFMHQFPVALQLSKKAMVSLLNEELDDIKDFVRIFDFCQ